MTSDKLEVSTIKNQKNHYIIQGYHIERIYGKENIETCVKNMIMAKLSK